MEVKGGSELNYPMRREEQKKKTNKRGQFLGMNLSVFRVVVDPLVQKRTLWNPLFDIFLQKHSSVLGGWPVGMNTGPEWWLNVNG